VLVEGAWVEEAPDEGERVKSQSLAWIDIGESACEEKGAREREGRSGCG
jgi:hypothetical protein